MKRDIILMRELLAKLDSLPLKPGAIAHVSGHDEELAIEGRTASEIEHHLDLLREAGLIDSPGAQPLGGGIIFRRLTNEGYDFLEQAGAVVAASGSDFSPAFSRKIFIVHGRDGEPRESVARFLEKLGFDPVILHEQANQGRTVIEKVEAHSDVGFAVVLLTPDDEGNLKGSSPQPRARQNVLLELGYFIGKLTRSRVCTLKVGDVEIPSDWRGVVDEPYDTSGGWKQTLARELEAAGYEIDWNKVMRR